MDRVELKPCPWPHEVERGPSVEVDNEEWNIARVICGDCGACGPYVNLDDYGGEEAAQHAVSLLWNDTRAIAAIEDGWEAIETAPKDGTLVQLLVDYSGEDGDHWIDDREDGLGRTVGHNNDDNVGPDEAQGWQFAGWCWTHDHYVEGSGRPIRWRPLPPPPEGGL